MNTTNSIIELRQQDGYDSSGKPSSNTNCKVHQDGHFTATLAKPVTVYDGDTISLRNAFVDNFASECVRGHHQLQ